MAGRPLTRAKKEAAARAAAGLPPLAPAVFVGTAPPPPPRPAARSMTVEEFRAEGRRKQIPFSQDIADLVCESVCCGVSLEEFCAEPDHPSRRTIVRWKREHPEFAQALHESRVFRAEGRSDQIDRVIADVQAGVLDAVSGRMVVDALRWQMSMENQRYRETTTSRVEMSGPGGSAISILNAEPPQMKEIARFLALVISNGERAARQLELQATEALPTPGGAHG
jgi:hypothetical protein